MARTKQTAKLTKSTARPIKTALTPNSSVASSTGSNRGQSEDIEHEENSFGDEYDPSEDEKMEYQSGESSEGIESESSEGGGNGLGEEIEGLLPHGGQSEAEESADEKPQDEEGLFELIEGENSDKSEIDDDEMDDADEFGLTEAEMEGSDHPPELIALQQIQLYQGSSGLLLRRAPFRHLVNEIVADFSAEAIFSVQAVEALQVAAEDYLVGLFRDANAVAVATSGDVALVSEHLLL